MQDFTGKDIMNYNASDEVGNAPRRFMTPAGLSCCLGNCIGCFEPGRQSVTVPFQVRHNRVLKRMKVIVRDEGAGDSCQ